MDLNDLHNAILKLADELGRTPTKLELCDIYSQARGALRLHYNDRYSDLINAAGLAPNRKLKITNAIFEKNIVSHLEQYEPKVVTKSLNYPKILIIPDVHFPFEHKKALEFMHEFAKENQPEFIFQIGDLMDMYSHAKFPRSHNIFTPKEEETLARKGAEKMWARLRQDCPQAKCIQMLGNHCVRPLKRTMESMPTMEHWMEKYFQELMTFEGVETILNAREEYKIKDIIFTHGYATKLGDHRDHYLANLVVGHSHTGGVSFRQINGRVLWELNSGYLADQYSKGLSYTATRTVKWTLGLGFIDKYGPRFVAY